MLVGVSANFLLDRPASSCFGCNLGTGIWCCKHIASANWCRTSRWIVGRSSLTSCLRIAGTPRTLMSSTSSETFSGNRPASLFDAAMGRITQRVYEILKTTSFLCDCVNETVSTQKVTRWSSFGNVFVLGFLFSWKYVCRVVQNHVLCFQSSIVSEVSICLSLRNTTKNMSLSNGTLWSQFYQVLCFQNSIVREVSICLSPKNMAKNMPLSNKTLWFAILPGSLFSKFDS